MWQMHMNAVLFFVVSNIVVGVYQRVLNFVKNVLQICIFTVMREYYSVIGLGGSIYIILSPLLCQDKKWWGGVQGEGCGGAEWYSRGRCTVHCVMECSTHRKLQVWLGRRKKKIKFRKCLLSPWHSYWVVVLS